MTRNGILGVAGACALVAALALPAGLGAQGGAAAKSQAAPAEKKPAAPAEKKPAASASTLGSVHIPRNVTADGQALAAGTYSLRVSDTPVTPVVGQPPSETKWVEFVQGTSVKGREIATVVTTEDAKRSPSRPFPRLGR